MRQGTHILTVKVGGRRLSVSKPKHRSKYVLRIITMSYKLSLSYNDQAVRHPRTPPPQSPQPKKQTTHVPHLPSPSPTTKMNSPRKRNAKGTAVMKRRRKCEKVAIGNLTWTRCPLEILLEVKEALEGQDGCCSQVGRGSLLNIEPKPQEIQVEECKNRTSCVPLSPCNPFCGHTEICEAYLAHKIVFGRSMTYNSKMRRRGINYPTERFIQLLLLLFLL